MSGSALRSSHLRSILRPLSVLLVFFSVPFPVLADSHARIVRLSYVQGDVELDKADGRGFNTAYLNMPLTFDSKLWARDGQAEVELEDGSSIRLTPDTIIAFTELALDNNGGRNTSIDLQQGTAYFDVRRREQDNFLLQIGRAHVQLLKTARFRADADKHNFEIAVLSGEIQVSGVSGSEVAVKRGETIRLDSDDPDRYYLAKGIDIENYDSWNNDRAKAHEQELATASTFGGNNGISYGVADLSAYGNYFNEPGYGYMWRPYGVGLAWDPFAEGYWISYPGYGYTFVSAYPWGWAPYRYGSWQFVNGHGWCWSPGSNWNNWQTVPPLRNVPPHYRPPEVPSRGAPVMVVSNGAIAPVPRRGFVVDNDNINRHWPHSSKIGEGSSDAAIARPSSAPAQGLVSSTPSSAVQTGVSPTTPREETPYVYGPLRMGINVPRGSELNHVHQPEPAGNSTRGIQPVAPTQAPQTPPARVTPPERSAMPHASVPRMEQHASAPAPMRMESRSMGATSRPAPPMSSGGGMRMSSASPSMAGGGRASGGSSGGRHR